MVLREQLPTLPIWSLQREEIGATQKCCKKAYVTAPVAGAAIYVNVWVYVYIYTHAYRYTCMYMYRCIVYVCMYTYIYMCVCVHTYKKACLGKSMWIYVDLHMWKETYKCAKLVTGDTWKTLMECKQRSTCEKRKDCAHEETTTGRGGWRGKSRGKVWEIRIGSGYQIADPISISRSALRETSVRNLCHSRN